MYGHCCVNNVLCVCVCVHARTRAPAFACTLHDYVCMHASLSFASTLGSCHQRE